MRENTQYSQQYARCCAVARPHNRPQETVKGISWRLEEFNMEQSHDKYN